MARAYRNTALTYISEDEASMGECLAFNQTIGSAGQYPLHPEMVKYISFYRQRRDLYAATRDVATIAVFRSYPSLTYHNSQAQLSAILAEQALIQARIPFHLFLMSISVNFLLATVKRLFFPIPSASRMSNSLPYTNSWKQEGA